MWRNTDNNFLWTGYSFLSFILRFTVLSFSAMPVVVHSQRSLLSFEKFWMCLGGKHISAMEVWLVRVVYGAPSGIRCLLNVWCSHLAVDAIPFLFTGGGCFVSLCPSVGWHHAERSILYFVPTYCSPNNMGAWSNLKHANSDFLMNVIGLRKRIILCFGLGLLTQ